MTQVGEPAAHHIDRRTGGVDRDRLLRIATPATKGGKPARRVPVGVGEQDGVDPGFQVLRLVLEVPGHIDEKSDVVIPNVCRALGAARTPAARSASAGAGSEKHDPRLHRFYPG